MQYNLTINQFAACRLGLDKQLDAVDLLLFDFIYHTINNPSIQKTTIDGIDYWNIRASLVMQECPLLRINNRMAFFRRMQKLCNAGLIERYENNQKENTSYYKRGKLFTAFVRFDEPTTEMLHPVTNQLHPLQQKCYTNIIPNKHTIDPPLYISPLTGENISPQGEKSKTEVEVEEVEVEEAKPKKPKVKIEKNPLNMDCVPEDLVDVVNTWLNYKKEKQQTYKQSGFNAMVKKLIAYSGGDPQIAQQIIDNAMAANYMGFFPLKNNGRQQINPIVDVIHGAIEMSIKREKYEKQRNQQQQSNLYNDIF